MDATAITFPQFTGIRCLMMPYIQGNSSSVPEEYLSYKEIIESVFVQAGDIGFLTIDESFAKAGKPHRGARASFGRALHTEAGRIPSSGLHCWGGGGWGGRVNVLLNRDVKVLLASNIDASCAVWNAEHENTSRDGDIGDCAGIYPYSSARFLKAGEVASIGILTPHESLPVKADCQRQFMRILSSGVHGREPYFTVNPVIAG